METGSKDVGVAEEIPFANWCWRRTQRDESLWQTGKESLLTDISL